MRIDGKRTKRRRFIRTVQYQVAVEVEMVIPPDDPSEPCYESDTIEFLREVQERAERGDVDWLKARGIVYKAIRA
jgi:hypothetical protein